ncbi:MAG TPA: peptidoglycan endopeptidase [Pseudomonas xinjiangensis]|uniref:Peptidoglycan endopeptidase n=2 Tax=root TaxID=1 RepID=A0A7V1BQ52_9GAMM|nr:peptidoglycan endopeptidase [Halopseudomonas xinjiangensis]HEC48820.1 peptidoglycan endopeptidase [Halopseudomonas xinjiangensis]
MPLPGLLMLLMITLLSGCASTPEPVFESPSAGNATSSPAAAQGHEDVLFHAFSLIGTPYRYGGNSPDTGFDCSGLIHYVYREAAGLKLPRTTAGLSALDAAPDARQPLQPGDLVLFAMSGRRVDHAGIYVGEGRFLHAPSSGGRVRVDSLHAGHWQRSYKGSRRVLD